MGRPLLRPKILFGCILFCTEIIALRAAHTAEIAIPSATTNAAGAKSLALTVDRSNFTWPIVVRRNDSGDTALRVRVDFTSLQSSSAQVADALHLSLDGRDVAAAEFDLASLDQKEVRLSGTLPVEGEFTGQLGVIVDGKRVPYELKVTRRKPENQPKARLVGATTDGKLAMTSDKSAFEWPLVIRRDDVLEQDIDITPRISLMSGPSGTIVEPKLLKDGNPLTGAFKLPARGQQSLTLAGTADREGPYTGEISYDINGTGTTVVLNLTRTHPDLDFKVEPISKTFATTGSPVTLQLRLLNNSSTTREIYPPAIVQFERTDTLGSSPVQVAAGDYKLAFRQDDGKSLQSLKANGDAELTMAATITELATAGNYKGVMRFTAPDRKPADVVFELSLRLCWFWPALAIAAGVIVSALLRYYQSTGQPRLQVQQSALVLRSDLTTMLQAEGRDLKDREQRALTHLIAQIDNASDRLADPAARIDAASAIIDTVRRRSPLLAPWISSRRRRDSLRAEIADALPNTVEQALRAAFNALMNDGATDASIQTAVDGLNQMNADIDATLLQSFVAAAAKLREAINEFPEPDRPQFDPVATSIGEMIRQANGSNFEEAEKILAQARSKFAAIAAGLLRATLTAAQPAVGFEVADWAAFIAEITGLLDSVAAEPDPEKRVQRWTEANRRYLGGVIRHAKARVEELIAANVVGTEEALANAREKLVAAEAALTADKLGTARTRYQEAVEAAAPARPHLRAQGVQMGKTAATDADAPRSGADLPDSIIVEAIASVWPLPLGRRVTLAQVMNRRRLYSVGFAVVLLLIAVVSGLQLLYLANPAFGYVDLVVAFLWGAGLHAIAGQTFQGLTGLVQQLR
ncbi:hypothetical protein [Bradyrhizobium sp.]|jgi:hypothetical protein|uniref:hypothetical protein n=1 Tax=Bradyrhizobium sp. TaxID=376 RepID=UPI002DDD2AE7|nr:hypothetical protein [Bradyrhizobium sp.]HEV2155814.1 hypothetical protein [Bradyrhizobium sp.]